MLPVAEDVDWGDIGSPAENDLLFMRSKWTRTVRPVLFMKMLMEPKQDWDEASEWERSAKVFDTVIQKTRWVLVDDYEWHPTGRVFDPHLW